MNESRKFVVRLGSVGNGKLFYLPVGDHLLGIERFPEPGLGFDSLRDIRGHLLDGLAGRSGIGQAAFHECAIGMVANSGAERRIKLSAGTQYMWRSKCTRCQAWI